MNETYINHLEMYRDFVATVTSEASTNTTALTDRLAELERYAVDSGIPLNMALLLTAGIGLSSEGGEFCEVVKKLAFQGKPYNEEVRYHLMRELGDVIWYWTNACRALGFEPNQVIAENIRKLQNRYPAGEFTAQHSENRQAGDL